MGVGEENTALGQPINIGSLCIRMPIQAAYPIVQVIDRDKEDVGFGGSAKRGQRY